MKRPVLLLSLFLMLSAPSCRMRSGGDGAGTALTRNFPAVSVPSVLSQDPREAEDYALRHYWDAFADTSLHGLRCDTLFIGGVPKGDMEQAFSNWTYLLEKAGLPAYDKAVAIFHDKMTRCEKADSASNIYEGMMEIACRYLYDPNSPLRDEEMYLPLCSRLAGDSLQDSLHRAGFSRQAERCSRNRVGHPAADFSFLDRDGKEHSLYGIRAGWTLLFFSNPGCHACKEIIETLKALPDIGGHIARRELAIVNVYIDEDLGEWYKYMPNYPSDWFNGYDPDLVIRRDGLYDVRAIPSLYLLDRNKCVVLKDAPEPKMYHKLSEIFGEK